jgi:hypothetical protein
MYGLNGFYLTFADTTSTTTLGYDTSGNNNNWTTNNISLTAGTTYDAMTDVPTNTSATVANFPVMNPLWTDGSVVIAQGNLNVSGGNYGGFSTLTIPTSSKFYAEFTVTATQGNQGVGILKAANAGYIVNAFNELEYEMLVAQMPEIVSDDRKAQIIQGAFDYFSLEEGVKKYATVYKSLLTYK